MAYLSGPSTIFTRLQIERLKNCLKHDRPLCVTQNDIVAFKAKRVFSKPVSVKDLRKTLIYRRGSKQHPAGE